MPRFSTAHTLSIPICLCLDLTSFYSSIGRPSIDPDLMIWMLIIGYGKGIRRG
jgi:transposase